MMESNPDPFNPNPLSDLEETDSEHTNACPMHAYAGYNLELLPPGVDCSCGATPWVPLPLSPIKCLYCGIALPPDAIHDCTSSWFKNTEQ